MSILKSIMHHWNRTSESYDTLHPETEYKQVTDFGEGTIAHLISSALASTVTACSTGSVFGKLVEKLLDASGMRYNFTNSNAWYICLGSLFGGLIIQGGRYAISTDTEIITLPMTLRFLLGVVSGTSGTSGYISVSPSASSLTIKTNIPTGNWINWILFGM